MVRRYEEKCIIFSKIVWPKSNAHYSTGKASLNRSSLQDLMNYSTVDFLLVYSPSTITQAENCPFEP